jgi:hypothetical protein
VALQQLLCIEQICVLRFDVVQVPASVLTPPLVASLQLRWPASSSFSDALRCTSCCALSRSASPSALYAWLLINALQRQQRSSAKLQQQQRLQELPKRALQRARHSSSSSRMTLGRCWVLGQLLLMLSWTR